MYYNSQPCCLYSCWSFSAKLSWHWQTVINYFNCCIYNYTLSSSIYYSCVPTYSEKCDQSRSRCCFECSIYSLVDIVYSFQNKRLHITKLYGLIILFISKHIDNCENECGRKHLIYHAICRISLGMGIVFILELQIHLFLQYED